MRLLARSPLGQPGASYRGHEFHYAQLVQPGDAPRLFEVTDATIDRWAKPARRLATSAACSSI